MKIIGLEEHIVTPALREAWAMAGLTQGAAALRVPLEQLTDVDRRLADMDEDGVDVQVLSIPAPGVQHLTGADATRLARDANDAMSRMVDAHPDRFGAFATLSTSDPDGAIAELHRCVEALGFDGVLLNGRTGASNVDDPAMADVWAAIAELSVPVYLHPMPPVAAVQDAYYTGFGAVADDLLATAAIGWHYEAGVQLVRLICSATFDRHPDLQVIIGHWGEVVLFYEERMALLDGAGLGLARPIGDYLRTNVSYTGSGILSDRYLSWALEVVGADRIMYSTDYPFVPRGDGIMRRFLEEADLSSTDREKIAHGNWERLVGTRR